MHIWIELVVLAATFWYTLILSHVTMATNVNSALPESGYLKDFAAEKNLWQMWLEIHPRNYPGYDGTKYQVWVSNLRKVALHNARFAEGKEMYLQDLNKFSDQRPQRLKKALPPVPLVHFYKDMLPVTVPDGLVPDSVLWWQKGWGIRDQTLYPSGWAVSATRAVEAQIKRKTGQITALNGRELLDCVKERSNRPRISLDAFAYIQQNGLTTYSSYRKARSSGPNSCQRNSSQPEVTIHSYHLLKPDDQENLKAAVALIGPISVSIKVTEGFFFYKSGVFYDTLCQDDGEEPMHSVLLVGYGTDPNLGNFWKVQNTWGYSWGEKGYARMARSTIIDCAIASAAFYPVV